MNTSSSAMVCDGCGVPASAEHIAARLARLERSTRFRPVHMNVLFVAAHPMVRPEDDFYGPPASRDFFHTFLMALGISAPAGNPQSGAEEAGANPGTLIEFQRRGYYLAHLSECPPAPRGDGAEAAGDEPVFESVSRLAPTLIRRVRFNYKPKHVALLGGNLSPLIKTFAQAGLAPLLLLDYGRPLTFPNSGDGAAMERFRGALAMETPSGTSALGV